MFFRYSLNVLSFSSSSLLDLFSSITLLNLILFLLFSETFLSTLLFNKGFSLLKIPFLKSILLFFPSTNETTLFLFSNSFMGLFSEIFPNMLLTVLPIHEKASPTGFIIDFIYSQKLAKKLFTFCQLVMTRAAPVTSPVIKSPMGLLITANDIALNPVITAGKTVADKNENTPIRFALRAKIVLPNNVNP
ncbi:hypothetical protein IC220_06795 [Wolbachia endosymbiont of Pentalonia nigronervosa]|nr:hypothetical protein [Wolbachia endosymbiont of Pentalonia nigronervosa]